MDFKDLYNLVIATEDGILNLVDEYTLYCHYTGIDNLTIGRAYSAPYRRDEHPSFAMYVSHKENRQFFWKDHMEAESGDIFRLIAKIECLSGTHEVIAKINEDFGLGYEIGIVGSREKIVWYDAPQTNDIKIRITPQLYTSKGKTFWDKLSIGKDLLDLYNTEQVQYYWTYEGQQAPNVAPDPMFAYRTGAYYQLYSPYGDKNYKFRNDLPENYFFGYMQLPQTGKKLIIDKSSKDVIFCRRLNLSAVAGKSETTFIPKHKMLEFKDRFEEVYLMLDPDTAGKKMTDKYLSLYPWLIPRFLRSAKDKTDLCLKVGFEGAQEEIMDIIQ